ncbi:amidohydrolase [Brevibacterium sp.]|uniref:amidohydrolase n=1 Tax=Brevibacterium sp. TaxID=1701 RepID=UPI002810A4F7|nr:amidohydrolase [Brevibacterium sp.]
MQTIFRDGRIFTVDDNSPWAEAIAVENGRITAIGTDAEVLATARAEAEVLDLGGAFVLPGFVDVHNHHFVSGREALFELNIPIGADLDGIVTAVADHIGDKERAGELEPGGWVIGSPWASDVLEQVNSPAALARLDAASGGHPVVLSDDAHHNRWANSAAMAAAGITGNSTGVLFEAEGLPVGRAALEAITLSPAEEQAASKHAIGILHSFGITAFQDAGVSTQIMRALHALDSADELGAWVVSSMLINDESFGFDTIGDSLVFDGEQYRSAHHRPDFVKIFLDGVPPTRTGAFVEPYLPDDHHAAHHCGQTLLDPSELLTWLRRTAEVGLSAKIHCTGDASVHAVLNAVEALRAEGFTHTRYQVAHGQFVLDSDIPRFAQLGVDADISPFIWVPGPISEAIKLVLPPERAERMQPVRSQLDAGAIVAGGSDWPVSPTPNPWEGIEGLVTRQDPSSRYPGTLWPEQAITRAEAIRVFTLGSATSMGLGAECGSLSVGKSADFAVLDRDPFTVEASDLADVQVEQTWFAGRKVYQR